MTTILCIDDDPDFLTILNYHLAGQNYRVHTAPDGRQGVTLLRTLHPDILLLDLRMPGMDGFEVLATAKKESPELPVIVISGEGEMQDVIRALQLGAIDYLTKPIDQFTILFHAVSRALERVALIREKKTYQKSLESMVADRTAELHRTLQALLRNEKKLNTVIENFDGFICLCDDQCRISYVNPALSRYAGRDVIAEACGAALFGDVDGCPFEEHKACEASQSIEFWHPVDRRWYQVIHTPLADETGKIVERQLVLYDITEKKQALLDLQTREAVMRAENLALKANLAERYRFGEIVGKSAAMQTVYQRILKTAGTDAGVVIYGESGTGKELVARAIHNNSPRRGKPLISVNCGAIPENLIESEFFGHVKGAFSGAVRNKPGLLEQADGGTLFLDEVGEISPAMQTKLLRAIENAGYRPVGGSRMVRPDVRIIAATHADLMELVKRGDMRQDFFFRIHVITIELPPLRERREDIPLLADHFFSQLAGAGIPRLTGRMMAALMDYQWPGNVRELQNTILRYTNLGTLDFLGEHLKTDSPNEPPACGTNDGGGTLKYRECIEKVERSVITRALTRNDWHRGRAAKTLGLDPKTLRKKIRRLGLARSA